MLLSLWNGMDPLWKQLGKEESYRCLHLTQGLLMQPQQVFWYSTQDNKCIAWTSREKRVNQTFTSKSLPGDWPIKWAWDGSEMDLPCTKPRCLKSCYCTTKSQSCTQYIYVYINRTTNPYAKFSPLSWNHKYGLNISSMASLPTQQCYILVIQSTTGHSDTYLAFHTW